MTTPLGDKLLEALEPEAPAPDPATLEPRLQAVLAAARQAWPGCELGEATYLEHLALKLRGLDDPWAALERLHTEDLYLACACLYGDPAAVALFEGRVLPAADPAQAQLGLAPALLEESRQQVREHLLVGREGRSPAIGSYSGKGPLKAWVKITAIRAALRLAQRGQKEIPVEERVLEAMPREAQDDPELLFLKQHYRGAFKEALRQAIAALDDRETNLIRQHYLDGLTTYELGTLYRVHQATASRWLERARSRILASTRRDLMQRLQVDRSEYDSIMRLIESRLDITLLSMLVD